MEKMTLHVVQTQWLEELGSRIPNLHLSSKTRDKIILNGGVKLRGMFGYLKRGVFQTLWKKSVSVKQREGKKAQHANADKQMLIHLSGCQAMVCNWMEISSPHFVSVSFCVLSPGNKSIVRPSAAELTLSITLWQ